MKRCLNKLRTVKVRFFDGFFKANFNTIFAESIDFFLNICYTIN